MDKFTSNDRIKNHYSQNLYAEQIAAYKLKLEFAIKSLDATIWEYDIIHNLFFSDSENSVLVKGMNLETYISIHHPDDRIILRKTLYNLVQDKTDKLSLELRLITHKKTYTWIKIDGQVFERDSNGHPTVILGIKRNINNEHQLKTELIELRNKAEEADKLKSVFLANMSHEIRTPLNAIMGFSNLIASSVNDENLIEYAKLIDVNNSLLMQLINDVLDMAKIEADKLEFHMSEISLNELMWQLQQMFILRASSGVEIILETPPKEHYIISERNRITQVITNFLSNAVKFTTSGSIHLGYEVHKNSIYFYVTDTGKGIAAENIALVFDRFSKFDCSVKGTGLGLSISRVIVKKLGGDIGVESELGVGSKFWFTIPCIAYNTSTYISESL